MTFTVAFCMAISIIVGLLLDLYLEQVVERNGGTLSWGTKDMVRKAIMVFYIVISVLLYLRYFLSEIILGVSSLM